MKYALNTNFMVREFHMRLHLYILVYWKWSCYMEVIFITIRNITMTFLCKFILIQTNNCEYEVLNVKCQFCFYRKLPNKLVFFLLLCVFYDSFQTKLKKIVTYRGVSNSSLNDFLDVAIWVLFLHILPPPPPKKNQTMDTKEAQKVCQQLWLSPKVLEKCNIFCCILCLLWNELYSLNVFFRYCTRSQHNETY